MNLLPLILSAHPPFLFHSVIQSHGWYQLAPLHWDGARGILRQPLQLDDAHVLLLELCAHPAGLTAQTDARLAEAEIAEVTTKLAWIFNLDADYTEFYALADQEPRLAHCRGKAQGRLLRSPTLFEDVVKVLATTNIQWSGTKRLVRQLVQHFGAPLADPWLGANEAPRAFPTVATIAATDELTLRGLGWGYRAPYLLKLARGILEGLYDLEALRTSSVPTPDLRKHLLKLPGIGPYGAATLLGLLGRHDFIGVDTEAVSLVSKTFYNGQPVGEQEINAIFDRWGRFKSLAYWFWDWSGAQQSPMEAWEGKSVSSRELYETKV
jgi:3-methyladenine DNA glycosylase/8-oxoguanine DNA glycosylase